MFGHGIISIMSYNRLVAVRDLHDLSGKCPAAAKFCGLLADVDEISSNVTYIGSSDSVDIEQAVGTASVDKVILSGLDIGWVDDGKVCDVGVVDVDVSEFDIFINRVCGGRGGIGGGSGCRFRRGGGSGGRFL